jgi:hypothetical protein
MTQSVTPLKIDLLRGSEVSNFRLALAVLFFTVAVGWIAYKVLNQQPLALFDAALFIVFILNAAFQAIEGSGLSLAALVGKAYIIINEKELLLKPSVKDAERRIRWDDVKRLHLSGEMPGLEIRGKPESSRLDLSKLSAGMKSRTRETLRSIAQSKHIPID